MSQFWKSLRTGVDTFRQTFTGATRTDAAKRATPLQQAYGVGAVPSYPVSNKWEELAHNSSWLHVGIHAIGKQWGQASWVVYDESKQVNKSHAADAPAEQRTPLHHHPILDILENPNPMMGRLEFLYIVCAHLKQTAEFCLWEVRNGEGVPVYYWPIPRSWMTWLTATKDYPMGTWQVRNHRGTQGYFAGSPLAGGFELDARDVMIGKWPHPQYPGEGLSTLSACGRIIDIMEQMDLAVWSSLLNAYHNGMILLLDDKGGPGFNEEQVDGMVNRFRSRKAGADRAGSVGVLQGVKSIERPSVPLSELNPVEVRDQCMKMGLGILGVPNVATGLQQETGTYAGNAATMMTFAEFGIQPDLDLFASVLSRRGKLCGYWGGNWKLEGHAKRIDDPTLDLQKAEKVLAGVDKGYATKNEWRAILKLPPLPGGDELVQSQPQVPGVVNNFHGAPGGAPGDAAAPGQAADPTDGDAGLSLDLDLPDDPTGGGPPSPPGPPGRTPGFKRKAWLTNGHANGHANGVLKALSRPLAMPAPDALAVMREGFREMAVAMRSQAPPVVNNYLPPTPVRLDVRSPDVHVDIAPPSASVVNVTTPDVHVEPRFDPSFHVAAPVVNIEPSFNVSAPTVNVAAPNVTVEPSFHVAAPTVNVEAPTVNVASPTVNVAAPNVSVEAPTVHVAPPNVTVKPQVRVPKPDPVSVTVNVPEPKPPKPRTVEIREADGTKTTATIGGG